MDIDLTSSADNLGTLESVVRRCLDELETLREIPVANGIALRLCEANTALLQAKQAVEGEVRMRHKRELIAANAPRQVSTRSGDNLQAEVRQ